MRQSGWIEGIERQRRYGHGQCSRVSVFQALACRCLCCVLALCTAPPTHTPLSFSLPLSPSLSSDTHRDLLVEQCARHFFSQLAPQLPVPRFSSLTAVPHATSSSRSSYATSITLPYSVSASPSSPAVSPSFVLVRATNKLKRLVIVDVDVDAYEDDKEEEDGRTKRNPSAERGTEYLPQMQGTP